MKITLISAIVFVFLGLAGCMQATNNVYSVSVDPVTRQQTVISNSVTFLSAGAVVAEPNGVVMQGRIVDGRNYLTISYYSSDWLFMNQAQFRFDGAQRVYTISLNNVTRDILGGASIVERQTVPATGGAAGALVAEITRRSLLSDRSRLFVRLNGSDHFVTGYNDMATGYPSLGSFFLEGGEPSQ